MKVGIIVILAALAGTLAGVGIALFRQASNPWDGNPTSGGLARLVDSPSPNEGGSPQVFVDNAEFDFGTMDCYSHGSHDFVVRNLGKSPLELSAGGTSCRCTLSNIENEVVRPGEATKVTLKWNTWNISGAFQQTAVIFTNDPAQSQITLTLTGLIRPVLQAVPPEISFGQLTSDRADSKSVDLLCKDLQPLEIISHKLSDRATAKFFEVTFGPLSASPPQEESDAYKSGCAMRVAVKPGLPPGDFPQTIVIYTNLESFPILEVPVRLTIISNIEIAGPANIWNSKDSVLDFGAVRGETGAEGRLWLLLRGPHREQTEFLPEVIEPDFLKVSLGKGEPLGGGQVIRVPLVVEIPKDAAAASSLAPDKLKPGNITLKTTHPNIPRLSFTVRWQVKE